MRSCTNWITNSQTLVIRNTVIFIAPILHLAAFNTPDVIAMRMGIT